MEEVSDSRTSSQRDFEKSKDTGKGDRTYVRGIFQVRDVYRRKKRDETPTNPGSHDGSAVPSRHASDRRGEKSAHDSLHKSGNGSSSKTVSSAKPSALSKKDKSDEKMTSKSAGSASSVKSVNGGGSSGHKPSMSSSKRASTKKEGTVPGSHHPHHHNKEDDAGGKLTEEPSAKASGKKLSGQGKSAAGSRKLSLAAGGKAVEAELVVNMAAIQEQNRELIKSNLELQKSNASLLEHIQRLSSHLDQRLPLDSSLTGPTSMDIIVRPMSRSFRQQPASCLRVCVELQRSRYPFRFLRVFCTS